nr:MAG TPA: hypothetical protein [Caudoviricetes sp.]DAO05063.1 MAG TPA: hypothetical protein [Bacteriophage sp.]
MHHRILHAFHALNRHKKISEKSLKTDFSA